MIYGNLYELHHLNLTCPCRLFVRPDCPPRAHRGWKRLVQDLKCTPEPEMDGGRETALEGGRVEE